MKIKLNLAEQGKTPWPATLVSCEPMLVRDGENLTVVIVATNRAVYFRNDGEIVTYSGVDYLKSAYTFVRYLEPGESVTFTV